MASISELGDVVFDLKVLDLPFWFAIVVGILLGWAWRPKWVKQNMDFTDSNPKSLLPFTPSPAPIAGLSSFKTQSLTCIRWISDVSLGRTDSSSPSKEFSSSEMQTEKSSILNLDDFIHLHKLFERKDGGPAWIPMMNKSANNMSYQAWRRDPETGPPQYCSRTVYEDATPEILRDFFWDDEFRLTWDDMLAHAETLEKCSATGTAVVRWVRKFPLFCSDREYIIGRRIWSSGSTYYCVTKGVPSSSVPRRDKPRRVDLYYSSWCIRAVESERDGRRTASEVTLFHHEDMGIPWEIAKLGVRQGMWGAVRKIEPALRAYQRHRAASPPLSPSALMAQINTKVDVNDALEDPEEGSCSSESPAPEEKRGIPRMVVVAGAVALALTMHRGLVTKAVVFGVARRFAGRLTT